MTSPSLNTFLSALRDLCSREVLAEKWLLAPSLRIGHQWLDAIALTGQPILNARVKTLRSMALELAAGQMERKGQSFLRGAQEEMLTTRLFERVIAGKSGYLSRLRPGPGLIRTLKNTLGDLRLAGISAGQLTGSKAGAAFEEKTKGRELQALLSGYERALDEAGLVDHADVLRIAAASLEGNPLPDGLLVIRPETPGDLEALELTLWRAVPEANRRALPVDPPGTTPAGTRIFRATGAANEAREVLRRVTEQGIPFDQVEILYTDSDTYVPLLFELTSRLAPEGAENLPVTFSQGLPVRYFRPGRALMAWLSWLRNDFDQATLARMIQDGLLNLDTREMGFARHAALLRSLSIGTGRKRYRKTIDSRLSCEKGKADEPDRFRIAGFERIRTMVDELLTQAPEANAGHKQILQSAAGFLANQVRSFSRLDEYARKKLIKEITRLADALEPGELLSGLDLFDWLGQLPQELRVGGAGPRAGCLYVAPQASGGHSGRPHVFVLGLDDTRFPGAGLQDPLLLDGERSRLSGRLPTAAGRLLSKVRDFHGLLARLRGNITLSYESRSLEDDRDLFPSNVLFSAFRDLSGNSTGDQSDFLKWLPEPASFAPQTSDRCLDASEWWLQRLCVSGVGNLQEILGGYSPNLDRGIAARRARESSLFTEYDGHVPRAGSDLDPEKVLSASALEMLGRCPLEYFFKYLLKIEPPEEYLFDPALWLDPAAIGSLMHEVFYDFMSELTRNGKLPRYDRDREQLLGILEKHVKIAKAKTPPPNQEVFQRDCQILRRTALIFLIHEEQHCQKYEPFCFEAAVGMESQGAGCRLDTTEPVPYDLPDGKVIKIRGRIDRIDRLKSGPPNRFAVWDYKTGSSKRFRGAEDPFRQGRLVQNTLYIDLAEARLKKVVSADARAVSFGYFFPGPWEQGRRIEWRAGELTGGPRMIAHLYRMLTDGCFPFSDRDEDLDYSDYLLAFGDRELEAARMRAKLENPENTALDSFRSLRKGDGDD